METTVALLSEVEGEQQTSVAVPARYRPEDFAGMSQVEALIALAERNGGFVKVSEGKRMLIEARLTRSKKRVYQIVTSILLRSNRFGWAEPATYGLIPQESNTGHEREQSTISRAPESDSIGQRRLWGLSPRACRRAPECLPAEAERMRSRAAVPGFSAAAARGGG